MPKIKVIILGLGWLILAWPVLAAMDSANYTIYADVLSTGGNYGTSDTNYKLWDTLGEAIISTASSTSYGVKQGFQLMNRDNNVITLSLSAASLNFGTLSASETKTASHTLTVSTNAANGYTISYAGSTLSFDTYTISPIGASPVVPATPGSIQQFGLNVINPTGSAPIGSTVANYGDASKYAFSSGDVVAQANSAVNQTVYTVGYVANIQAGMQAGTYTTNLVFTATGNF
ncbi:MAG: hypothetical protein WCW02_03115 [Candidatus Buchananbacteria bacterium]